MATLCLALSSCASYTQTVASKPVAATSSVAFITNSVPIAPSVDAVITGTASSRYPPYRDEVGVGTLWQRMRQRLPLAQIDSPRIDEQLEQWLRFDPLTRFNSRDLAVLSYLVDAVDARGLPLELALLPVIESSLRPTVTSYGNAAGLWQIRPLTAERFGLTVVERYDGRYDMQAATIAALDYLEYLYRYFDNDWLLAMAAYNCGEGRLQRAIADNQRRGRATDFWRLTSLPPVTQQYVPKILALARLVDTPAAYAIRLPAVAAEPQLVALNVDPGVDLFQAASAAEVSSATIARFNPFLRLGSGHAPPWHYRLLLPVADAASLRQRLLSLRLASLP